MDKDLIEDLEQERGIGWTTMGGRCWTIKKFRLSQEVKDFIIKYYDAMIEDKSVDIDPEGVFCGTPNYDQRIGRELVEDLRHRVEQWFMKKYPEGKEIEELEITKEMMRL